MIRDDRMKNSIIKYHIKLTNPAESFRFLFILAEVAIDVFAFAFDVADFSPDVEHLFCLEKIKNVIKTSHMQI